MVKKNCWEIMLCGREPGGAHVGELGLCPAAKPFSYYDGKNEGKSGGRYCWRIAGTLCGGKTQGTYADKIKDCKKCEFYVMVREQEGEYFIE
ncbi:MAG TPA: hypothetical protein DCL35_07135 [Candidatus Omnitrophica bacterium]|nr:hypothetical protein [Candidatus Omnitrophota bacterium]